MKEKRTRREDEKHNTETENIPRNSTTDIEVPPREEINCIIKMLKNNKAPGETTVTDKILKAYGGKARKVIYRIVNKA